MIECQREGNSISSLHEGRKRTHMTYCVRMEPGVGSTELSQPRIHLTIDRNINVMHGIMQDLSDEAEF